MSRGFTLILISGLGEPYLYHDSGENYKNRYYLVTAGNLY